MTNRAQRYLDRTNPARSWADLEAREGLTPYADAGEDPMVQLEPTAPFELVRERMIPRFDGTKTLKMAASKPTEVFSDHLLMRVTAGWRIIRRAAPLMLLAVLGSSTARAEEKCAKGEVEWKQAESGTLEAQPLQGLSLVMSPSNDPHSVVFAITYLQAGVSCASTLTPGIEAMVSCTVPMNAEGGQISAYIRIRGNGSAHGEVCSETPDAPKPKVRS